MATKTRRLADLLANIDDNSKVTSAGLLDATITAADLANDSVGAAEIIDDAVTAAAIADDAVGADQLASNAVVSASIVDANITAAKLSSTALASVEHVKPHIQPGVLHPAWSGLLTENTAYTFTDSSATGHVITSVGDSHHSGAQEKVGSTSLKFDGSDTLHFGANHTDFQFGAGDFTIEFWFNLQAHVSSGDNYIGPSSLQWGTSNGFRCIVPSGTPRAKLQTSIGSSVHNLTGTTAIATGTWYHFAAVRIGTSLKLYLNGTQEATATVSGSHDHGNAHANRVISIAARQSSATVVQFDQFTNVHVDEIRIVKGLGVYTGNFTAPTVALTTTWSAGTNIAANSTASNVKLLIHSDNGGHVGAYGAAQSDSKKYYYTDIKGSKPIKDPRIGAHFGSQRHIIKSMQLLEQETAAHSKEVYSIDGREWMRFEILNGTPYINNGDGGVSLTQDNGANGIYEITGYFNNFNVHVRTRTNRVDDVNVTINGGTIRNSADTDKLGGKATADTPLGGRFVNEWSLINHGDSNVTSDLGTTPAINTLKFEPVCTSGEYFQIGSIELIAQDTTSLANKSKIQIPPQNVVSYGKKFSVSAAAHHYNPFDGLTGAKTLTQLGDYIDTDTSLGMENWKGGTANYYKPFNGGRVVKWIASDGTIKTSVTMMPPNAQNKGQLASNAVSDAHIQAGTNDDIINFNTSAIDHSLSEVAKTFHFREFGNGSANQGHGGSRADFSMMDTAGLQGLAWCMDDGLTAMAGDNINTAIQSGRDRLTMHGSSCRFWITFIGTGISVHQRAGTHGGTDDIDWDVDGVEAASLLGSAGSVALSVDTVAQNLSYGTHMVKFDKNATNTMDPAYEYFTFYQPKMPPIPENAVVIADYMLMADHVTDTVGSLQHVKKISKGVRRNNCARDLFYDRLSGSYPADGVTRDEWHDGGFYVTLASSTTTNHFKAWLPSFATRVEAVGFGDRRQIYVDAGSAETQTVSGASYGAKTKMTNAQTLGIHTFKSQNKSGQNGDITAIDCVIPIHTSSHYQSFETPYLHELVGGDRNMEQNNLVVTSDGKTWDEVTRDTSYIGNLVLTTQNISGNSASAVAVFTAWRGAKTNQTGYNFYKTDYVVWAYDRAIILKDGFYDITRTSKNVDSYSRSQVFLNGTAQANQVIDNDYAVGSWASLSATTQLQLKRGDWLQVKGYTTNTITSEEFALKWIK